MLKRWKHKYDKKVLKNYVNTFDIRDKKNTRACVKTLETQT